MEAKQRAASDVDSGPLEGVESNTDDDNQSDTETVMDSAAEHSATECHGSDVDGSAASDTEGHRLSSDVHHEKNCSQKTAVSNDAVCQQFLWELLIYMLT